MPLSSLALPGWFHSRDLDLISRGTRRPTPVGRTVFIVLRALDPLLQYSILAHGTLSSLPHSLGLRTHAPGLATNTGLAVIDSFGLSPYRLALLGMAVGSAAKQIYWAGIISAEEMPAGAALEVALFNSVSNAFNSLAFTCVALSASAPGSAFPPVPLLGGAALYAVGLALEWWSEVQRAAFKASSANAGKPFTGGLWSLARHVNYGGYTLWRAGYALAGAGWAWGAFVGSFFVWDFSTRAVPILERYCASKVCVAVRACRAVDSC